ncbi:Na+-driven multidrug efflux pump [Neobacillus cucumis]|nr:Na+-driven multidrug efflux pump [Neobacillus cucumis]
MNNRAYLSLAIPLTISTMTTPLLGAVDTAVVGQLPDPAYIGGVALGTLIFNTLYWVFGFLRVSTSAFAAQANGASDPDQGILALARPFLLAIVVGICFILLQWPIEYLALKLFPLIRMSVSLRQNIFESKYGGTLYIDELCDPWLANGNGKD